MNTKQKYDALIMDIEAKAKLPYKRAHDIVHDVAATQGISSNDLNALFLYMTGRTILGYIKERKLMAAYRSLLEGKNKAIQRAIDISGFDNESSFTKKFSSVFGMPPSEAMRKKDLSLLTEPKTWDVVSCTDVKSENAGSGEKITEVRFGLPAKQYEKIMEAHRLERIYGFSSQYSSIAFEISEQLNWPLREAYSYLDEIRTFLSFSWTNGSEDEDQLRAVASDPYFCHMYIHCGISPETAALLLDEIGLAEKEIIIKLEPKLIKQYMALYPHVRFEYFKSVYMYYWEWADSDYTDENYEEYIDLICRGVPKEGAFEMLIPAGRMDAYPIDIDENEDWERYDSIEKMAEEDASWRNIRIDLEPDEENLAYEYDDADDPGPFDF